MRVSAFLIACALMLAGCAHGRLSRPDHPGIAAVAQFVIQALAPSQSGSESDGYRWRAFLGRVSDAAQWRSSPASDAGVRRDGRLTTGAGVIAIGDSEHIAALSVDTDAFHAVALIEALRRAGAEVSFQADYETYSEYIVTPPGRDVGLLTTYSTCSPFERRPARPCRNYVTLTFNPF